MKKCKKNLPCTGRIVRSFRRFLPACLALGVAVPALAEDMPLDQQFLNPPREAKPSTWWHWVDGNVTREGITGDLEAMKEIGLGGAILFNIGSAWPEGFLKGIRTRFFPDGPAAFMEEPWLSLVDHAFKEADRLGLELGVHNCDGYTTSGGPWITPETSMKQLTWSITAVEGPSVYEDLLSEPHSKLGFYRDIAVLAYRRPEGGCLNGPGSGAEVRISPATGEASLLADGDAETGLTFPATQEPRFITLSLPGPQTVRSLVFRGLNRFVLDQDFPVRLEASQDGVTFVPVTTFTLNWDIQEEKAPVTVACEETRARVFRLTFNNPWTFEIGEIELHDTARIHFFEAKAGWVRFRGDGGESHHFKNHPGPDRHRTVPSNQVLDPADVQVLTTQMQDGRLQWKVPSGRWHILRMGYTSTGHTNVPATRTGFGLECDKLSPTVVRHHLDQYVGKLSKRHPELLGKAFAMFETDSWECGPQTWTEGLEERFMQAMGYDIRTYFPLIAEGIVMESPDVSERVLWDWRRFLADEISRSYYGAVADYARGRGLTYVAEPAGRQQYMYDPVGYHRNADIPMGEVWAQTGPARGVRVDNRAAASAAHLTGWRFVASEMYTAGPPRSHWGNHPFSLKPLGDRAFANGVNRMFFHTFAHQPFGELKPGFTMAMWGMQFNRGNTWWKPGRAWIDYISRSQFLLQEGRFVADVLAFLGDDVPVYLGWRNDFSPPLPEGYDYDGGDFEALRTARVENGELVLSSGMRYRVLLLPDRTTMRAETLQTIERLVRAGLTVVGPRPTQSPSRRDLGQGDATVRRLAKRVWGACDGVEVTENRYGQGRVFSGLSFEQVFERMQLPPDFEHNGGPDTEILFIHRHIEEADVYFVSNQSPQSVNLRAAFRVTGRVPEIWDPATGLIRTEATYREEAGRTILPLHLDPIGSAFVVFRRAITRPPVVAVNRDGQTVLGTDLTQPGVEEEKSYAVHGNGPPPLSISLEGSPAPVATVRKPGSYTIEFADGRTASLRVDRLPPPLTVNGSWQVTFPPGLGAPDTVTMNQLASLSEHPQFGVRHFSGTATYLQAIEVPEPYLAPDCVVTLDLGLVEVMAEVEVNGHPAGILWKPPYAANVTGLLRPGRNELAIQVTNLWPNRLIGDAHLPEEMEWSEVDPFPARWPEWLYAGRPRPPTERVSFSSYRAFRKDDPLPPSGLIGPVRLRVELRRKL